MWALGTSSRGKRENIQFNSDGFEVGGVVIKFGAQGMATEMIDGSHRPDAFLQDSASG